MVFDNATLEIVMRAYAIATFVERPGRPLSARQTQSEPSSGREPRYGLTAALRGPTQAIGWTLRAVGRRLVRAGERLGSPALTAVSNGRGGNCAV